MLRVMTNKKILFTVLALAFLLRVFWIFAFSPKELIDDPYYYDKTARSIVQGEGYREGNLSAYRPPGYPYFLAGVYSLFGYSHLAVKIIQALLSTLSCVVIYFLTKRLLNESSALLAACFFAFYPQFIRYPGELWSETLFIFLFLLLMLSLYKFIESPSYKLGMISGILLGISALTREVALLFIIPIAIWMFICTPAVNRIKSFIKEFGIIIIFMALVISPWAVRNYIVFHKFIPISTNGGLNFYMGNNPEATGEFLWKLPNNTIWPDHLSNAKPSQLSALELQVSQKGYKEGIKFIINNPAKFIKLSMKKLILLWRLPYYRIDLSRISAEDAFRIVWLVFYTILLFAAIPSALTSLKRFGGKWLLLHFWVILISAIHMLTYSSTRYRLPIIPILIIFSVLSFDGYRNRILFIRQE